MKKSFMTRVLAVTLSTAMAFSVSSAGNLMTASAATKPFVSLKTKFKTLTVGQKYKMTLKNNSIKWRIQKATSSDKTIVKPYLVKPTYVKLKGLKEGRVKVTYKLKTTKRKTNNTKTLKGTVKVKAKGGDTEDPGATFSATATAADTTSVKITFSQAIDTEGVTAENFTINNDVTVREAKVSEDGKTVDLTIAGATYDTEYEVTVKGVKVAGEAKDTTCKFKTPAAAAGYQPKLDVGDKPMKSDGQSTRVVKFELRDSAGELVNAEGVEVLFETTLGNFAEPRATLDKGVAENTFTSQALNSTRTATITASVIAADNKDLIGQSVIGNIVLTPNPEQLTDTSIGAIITNAVAPTADRVVAYFQKDVEAKDFRKANGALDESKFSATVKSGVDSGFQNGNPHKVVGVLDVEGEPNALELLVETPMTDNTTISVTFQDKRNASSVINSSNTVYCKLTDGYQPSALKVNVVDNHTLEIEFSEAVLRQQDAGKNGQSAQNSIYGADIPANYAIDTLGLHNYWGVKTNESNDSNTGDSSNEVISKKNYSNNEGVTDGTVTVGAYRNAVDKRHIVTIKLGEGKYLQPGKHSLAISNVGDWAASTDGWRNIINTATVDFEVPADNARPNFELKVQSPEQFKLTANCDIALVNKNNTFRTHNSADEPNDVVELQQLINGTWTTISNHDAAIGYNPIMVSQINENGLTRDYLVETRSDWTEVCDTKNTYNHYYRNKYRLRIAANTIKNLSNGLTNEEIILNLSDDPIMQSMDGASPVIDKIEQAQDANGNLTSNYFVTFSEPVKMNDKANAEGTTPTQDTNKTISPYTAYFVKRDASQKSVQAEVETENFINAEDTMIRVKPVASLDAGDWDLYVRGASDDVGNTAATLSGVITVEAQTVSTNFRVVWAAVSKSLKYEDITAGDGNYIFVKFNKPISVAGGSANVGATLNYALNGNPLPTGSNIRAHIQGYDDKVERIDSITIELPRTQAGGIGSTTMDYKVSGLSSVLTISNAVTSIEGDTLSTEPGYNLPYHFGESGQILNDKSVYTGTVLTTLGDAVWGNAKEEQWVEITKSAKTLEDQKKAYIDALKSALANDKYRKIKLDSSWVKNAGDAVLETNLSINRIVDIDLNGCTIKGNVSISTTEAADNVKILNDHAQRWPAAITGNKDNTEKDVTLLINTPNSGVIIRDNIKITKSGNSKDAMKVNGVTSNTLENQAEYDGNILLTASNIGFKNFNAALFGADGKNGSLIVDTTGTVYVRGEYTKTVVKMKKAAELVLSEITAANDADLTIEAQAAASKVTIKPENSPGIPNIHVVAMADKVEVKQAVGGNMAKLDVDGGNFIQKDLNGRELEDNVKVTPTQGGAQAWFDELTVIDGAVKAGQGVELVTVSAVSGSAAADKATFNNNEEISKYITEAANNKSANDAKKKYTVLSVVPSISSNYIGYNSTTKKVYVKSAASSVSYDITETFTVAIKVKDQDGEEQTLTRTVKVVIQKAQS